MSTPPRMHRWPSPSLMLITDRTRLRNTHLESVASMAVGGGANVVQLREKDLSSGELYRTAVAIHAVLRGRALLIVNERADVAIACGADGVHVPEAGLPGRSVREIVGESCIVGRSVHSVEAAVQAVEDGADYVQVGSVFATRSKPGWRAAGLELVRAVAEAVDVPVIAVGGIVAGNVRDVVDAGADGVAAISAFMDSDDPKAAAEGVRAALDEAYAS